MAGASVSSVEWSMRTRQGGAGWTARWAVLLLTLASACVESKQADEPTEPHSYTCEERAYRSAAEEVLAAGLYDECEHDGECAFAEATTACQELCEKQVVNRHGQQGFATKIAAIDETYCATYLQDGCTGEEPICEVERRVPVCEAAKCTAIAPTTCDSEVESTLVRAELFRSDCTEDCGHVLVLGDPTLGACDEVVATWTDFDAATPNPTTRGKLTPLGLTLARRLTTRLEGIALEEMYTCPDCYLLSGMHLTLRRQNVETTHTYDPNGANVPEALAEANAFVTSLILVMSECARSELIEPPAHCANED
jgi:hypothetical protein